MNNTSRTQAQTKRNDLPVGVLCPSRLLPPASDHCENGHSDLATLVDATSQMRASLSSRAVRLQLWLIIVWTLHNSGSIGRRNSVLRTLHRRKTSHESRGSVHEDTSPSQRSEKQISIALSHEFSGKVQLFDRNTSKYRFDHETGNSSAIPKYSDRSGTRSVCDKFKKN